MIWYRLLFIVVFGAFALVLAGVPPVYAQEEEDESLEFQLEDITVTATKREMDHQKVPMQIDVITGDDLLGTEKDNIDDILREVSNVVINKYDDGMRITLRGQSDDMPVAGGIKQSSPTVAVNIDGAYTNESTGAQNLFDLERVEVLAGPQSTLYGSNSPGGVVNVVTAAPKADRFEVKASGEFGNYGLFDGQAVVNVPILRDKLAMRLSAKFFERDSWIEGAENAQENTTVRLKTAFTPSDTFDTTLSVTWMESSSGGRLNGNVKLFDHEDGVWANEHSSFDELGTRHVRTPVTNPWTASEFGAPPTADNPNNAALSQDALSTSVQLDINIDTPLGNISIVPSYSERESDQYQEDFEVTDPVTGELAFTGAYQENFNEQKGADVRIASPEDFPFKWIIGGTYHESFRQNTRDVPSTLYDPLNLNDRLQEVNQEKKAVYANITYPLTDQFRGTLGYRYSWDEATFDERMYVSKAKGGLVAKVVDTGMIYEDPDYNVGFEYDLTQDSMAWGSWATSYRMDARLAEEDPPRPAETLDAYSVGVKNRFLNDKLQVNATAYYYDYKDKWYRGGYSGKIPTYGEGNVVIESEYTQDTTSTWYGPEGTDFNFDGDYDDTNIPPASAGRGKVPGTPGPPPGYTSDLADLEPLSDPFSRQQGDFESYGVDVTVDWVPTGKDRLDFRVSYMSGEWSNAVVDFAWGDALPDNGIDYSGEDTILTPEWVVNLSYQHRFDLGNFGSLIPQFDVQWKDAHGESVFERIAVDRLPHLVFEITPPG